MAHKYAPLMIASCLFDQICVGPGHVLLCYPRLMCAKYKCCTLKELLGSFLSVLPTMHWQGCHGKCASRECLHKN